MDFDEAVQAYGARIEANSATLLVGAGLSVSAGYPNWKGLLQPFITQLQLPESFDNLTMVAQYVANVEGGRDRLVGDIVKAVASVDPTSTQNHRLIAELPVGEIWTTNYDQLIERACVGSDVIETDDQFIERPRSAKRIYKMHGSIRAGVCEPSGGADNLVITRDDFETYFRRHPRAWQLLQAQFLTKSFLFLGFSMSDPNFDAVTRLVRIATPAHFMEHYTLMKRDSATFDFMVADLKRVGVQVVEIDDYQQVTEFLRKLLARTRPVRVYISGSQPGSKGDGQGTQRNERYPTVKKPITPELLNLVEVLGRKLGAAGIRIAAGSELCAIVGYSALDGLAESEYDPDRVLILRRQQMPEDDTAMHTGSLRDFPNLRRGTIMFVGSDPGEMRDAVFKSIRAVILIAGGKGTADERRRAEALAMGVIPIGRSGGTALDVWQEMTDRLSEYKLGSRPIDQAIFAQLNDPSIEIATDAAVVLVRQAMSLETPATSVSDNSVTPPR